MNIKRKQVKITKLFRKKGTASRPVAEVEDDNEDLKEEVKQLGLQVNQKQLELFQLQRNSYKHKAVPLKKKDYVFVRPETIVLESAIESSRQQLELLAMLTGMEVQSYTAGDHCCVVFHMQHKSEHVLKHGLRIDMTDGKNEIVSSNLPIGFNMEAVMEDFDNPMKPECLPAIRKALFAYYDRLEQFNELKKYVNIEAELFKTLDTSHIQITLTVLNEREEDPEHIELVLMLDYRVYNIRPKNYYIRELDLPEETVDVLKDQCAVFKKKPLIKAFKEAFLSGIGPFTVVQQIADRPEPQSKRQHKNHNKHQNNDDTFRPEECSESEEEVE